LDEPHIKIFFNEGKHIYVALRAENLTGISIKAKFGELKEGLSSRILEDDGCESSNQIVKVDENSISVYPNLTQKCLQKLKSTKNPVNFELKIAKNGNLTYLTMSPTTTTVKLSTPEKNLLLKQTSTPKPKPAPKLTETFSPKNIANFSSKGIANKTQAVEQGGSLFTYIGLLATPICGVSLLSLTMSMSFLLTLIQKFRYFNVNYGPYMRKRTPGVC
jgi:hypothetical protein